jgi:hypothetical protein
MRKEIGKRLNVLRNDVKDKVKLTQEQMASIGKEAIE